MEGDAGTVHNRKTMRAKRTERIESKRAHQGNVTAGHIDTNETMLHRSGLRGRKSTIFVVLLSIIAVLVILNFVLTILILSVLRLDSSGMPHLYLGLDKAVVFRGNAPRLYDAWIDKFIGAYVDESLVVSSQSDEQLRLSAGMYNGTRNKVILDGGESTIECKSAFRVQSGENWLATFNEDDGGVQVRKLTVSQSIASSTTDNGMEAKRFQSDGTNLSLSSDEHIRLRRADEISFVSANASLTAKGNITLGDALFPTTTTFSGSKSINLKGLPEGGPDNNTQNFKLCACVSTDASTGRRVAQLYRVRATAQGCMTNIDPCA